MTRIHRNLAALLLPALALLWLIWPLRSGAPESADLRTYLREPPLPLGPNAWRACADMPEHLFGRALYQALLRSGLDFPELALLGVVGACLALLLWREVAARTRPLRPLGLFTLTALLLSPTFGGDWLMVERGRVFLPAIAGLAMVVLLARAGVWRTALALLVSLGALATHEAGSLLWLAALPLFALRPFPGAPRAAACWSLVHVAALLLCYDESARPTVIGLVRGLGEAPEATLELLARTLTAAVPDLIPTSSHDELALAAVLLLGLLGAGLATWRSAPSARERRVVPLCVALAGLAQALALTHSHTPLAVAHTLLREITWGTWLLPVGVLAVWADLVPRVARRSAPILCGALLVLIAQDWRAGREHIVAVARVLRQAEALMVFAELGPANPASARPAVVESTARAWLRRRGLVRGAAPTDGTLAGLTQGAGVAGVMLPPTLPEVRGAVVREAGTDLVLLVRQAPGGAARLAKVAAPDTLATGAHAAWAENLAEGGAFAEGETLRAWAFDVRARAMRPLAGAFVWRAGAFVPEAP